MPFRSASGILFVIVFKPSYSCIASALMISPLNLRANSTASYLWWSALHNVDSHNEKHTCDFPVPVAPTTAMSGFRGGFGDAMDDILREARDRNLHNICDHGTAAETVKRERRKYVNETREETNEPGNNSFPRILDRQEPLDHRVIIH